ncbi:MAG TPA: hypothetical protein VFX59_11560 [Polyangiales bacterium]|nr:hypothetical protein [Polyangiales bacterium]
MQTEVLARRAYELGRVRMAAQWSLTLTLVAASIALLLDERPWLKLPFASVLWFAVSYRGRSMLRGARLGVIAGLLTSLWPMAWLRPCCAPGATVTCTMPGVCVAFGALIGLALASRLPRAGNRMESALGMALGALSLVWLKCSLLLWGETIGLVGGLMAGIAAMALVPRPVHA